MLSAVAAGDVCVNACTRLAVREIHTSTAAAVAVPTARGIWRPRDSRAPHSRIAKALAPRRIHYSTRRAGRVLHVCIAAIEPEQRRPRPPHERQSACCRLCTPGARSAAASKLHSGRKVARVQLVFSGSKHSDGFAPGLQQAPALAGFHGAHPSLPPAAHGTSATCTDSGGSGGNRGCYCRRGSASIASTADTAIRAREPRPTS